MPTTVDIPTWLGRIALTVPQTGLLTPQGIYLFQQIFNRIGGVEAMSITEIEVMLVEQASMAAHQSPAVSAPAIMPPSAPVRPAVPESGIPWWQPHLQGQAPAQPVGIPGSDATRQVPAFPEMMPQPMTGALAALQSRIGNVETVTESFTIGSTGFAADPSGTALYALLDGGVVALFLPALTGTSDATTFTLTGLPAAITPTQTSWHQVVATNNGVDVAGLLKLTGASTTIDLYASVTAGLWTALGTKALLPTWITYALL
jgi:hypothetical protein